MSPSFTITDAEEQPSAFTPHRHDYYSIFLLETGSITVQVDIQEIFMHPASIMLIHPGQVHHCLQAKQTTGWVLSFDAKLPDVKARAALDQCGEASCMLQLDADELINCKTILSLIYQASQVQSQPPFHMQLLHSLVNALFYKAVSLIHLRQSSNGPYAPKPFEVAQRFRSLVKKHYLVHKRPYRYAGLMNLSVSHLNDTVKAVTGYPSTYFIQQQVAGEAQRYLLYTSKSIKEVASALGYDDYKYFIRLFTKVMGLSPSRFRAAADGRKPDSMHTVMIFRTNINSEKEAALIRTHMLQLLPHHQINFDLTDVDRILRIEGTPVPAATIRRALQQKDSSCEEMD